MDNLEWTELDRLNARLSARGDDRLPTAVVRTAHRDGDRINAVLAAAGYSFSLLLRWLAGLLRALVRMLLGAPSVPNCA